MSIYHGDQATPEQMVELRAILGPILLLQGVGLPGLAKSLLGHRETWSFVRWSGVQGRPEMAQRVHVQLMRLGQRNESTPIVGCEVWAQPGWSLAALVVLVEPRYGDHGLGPGDTAYVLGEALRVASSALILAGHVEPYTGYT